MHCEGIMSGELKHGPLAMVDEKMCIVMIICKDNVYKVLYECVFVSYLCMCSSRFNGDLFFDLQKSLNALQQVIAREGQPIVIVDATVPISDLGGMKHVLRVPRTVDCLQSILTVIPLQLLSYHIAELNGRNVCYIYTFYY